MARRSLTLLVAVGVVAAAGCFGGPAPPPPPPPPQATQVCGQSFAGAGNYQIAFYNLGHANTGWITADGFVPVRLPDGSTAWWMSDTNTGTANPDNSVSNGGTRHNTVVQQAGSCLTPRFGSPDMINGTGGAWYWPGAAVIQGNTMLVFSHKVVPAGGQPGFNWRVVGASVARFSLPSLQLLGSPVDMPLNNAPNDGNPIPWGVRAINGPGGMVYLYGTTRFSSPFGPVGEAWLARAPFDQPTNLEYFTNPGPVPLGPAWSTNFADAKPMTFTEGGVTKSSPLAQLSVVPYGSGYLAGAFSADVFQDSQGRSFVWAWTAETPEGPWQRVQNLDGTPKNIATFTKRSPDQIAYDAHIEQLSGAGWTVVFSANDPVRGWNDFTLYRGEFRAPSGLPAP